jgi:hypothetical protein
VALQSKDIASNQARSASVIWTRLISTKGPVSKVLPALVAVPPTSNPKVNPARISFTGWPLTSA